MASSDLIIRNATLEDLSTLLEFEQELIKAERHFDVTLGNDPISYYDIKKMILDEDSKVIVAETDGKIISSGYAIRKKARHYLNHEYYAYLGFMYTHPDHRGKGINSKIVEELKHWSHARGFKEIRLTVYAENVPAIRAYGKVGFKSHLVEMRLE